MVNSKFITVVYSAAIFLMIGSLTAQFGFQEKYSHISTLFIVLMALPTFYYFTKSNFKKLIPLVVLLGLFALVIEGQAVITGWPYSEFQYSNLIAGKIFGIVPWTIAFAWTPLLLGWCYLFNPLILKSKLKFIVCVALGLVATDLLLDPAAVKAGLWIWEDQGSMPFYGIPFQNFVGWFISGVIGAGIYAWYLNHFKLNLEQNSAYVLLSLVWTLAFWTGAAVYYDLTWVYIIGFLVYFLVIREFRRIKS
jgi:putative membrane protein